MSFSPSLLCILGQKVVFPDQPPLSFAAGEVLLAFSDPTLLVAATNKLAHLVVCSQMLPTDEVLLLSHQVLTQYC